MSAPSTSTSTTLTRFAAASAILTVASALWSGLFSTSTKMLGVATGAFLLLGVVLGCWKGRARLLSASAPRTHAAPVRASAAASVAARVEQLQQRPKPAAPATPPARAPAASSLSSASSSPPVQRLAPPTAQSLRRAPQLPAAPAGPSTPPRAAAAAPAPKSAAPAPIATSRAAQGPAPGPAAAQPLSPVTEGSHEDSEDGTKSEPGDGSDTMRSSSGPVPSAEPPALAQLTIGSRAVGTAAILRAPLPREAPREAPGPAFECVKGIPVVEGSYPQNLAPDELLIVPERSGDQQIFRLQIGDQTFPEVTSFLVARTGMTRRVNYSLFGKPVNYRPVKKNMAMVQAREKFDARKFSLIASLVFPEERRQRVKKVTVFIAYDGVYTHALQVLSRFNCNQARDWIVEFLGADAFKDRQTKIIIGSPPEKLNPPFRCVISKSGYLSGLYQTR